MAGTNNTFGINKPSEEETKRIKKLLRDRGPSSRKKSSQSIDWESNLDIIGQPFCTSSIPISKLYEMRRDPAIAFALYFIKVPFLRAPWYIECNDPQIARFVEMSLKKIYNSFVLSYLTSLEFGYSGIIKRFELASPDWVYSDQENLEKGEQPVWPHKDIPAVVWKEFVNLPPETIEPIWKANGDFNGIRYFSADQSAVSKFPFATEGDYEGDNKPSKIDLEHALWVTNDVNSVFGDIWGYPRIGFAYRYWWSYWYRWALSDRHFEQYSDPTPLVRFPNVLDSVDSNGDPIDFREVAYALAQAARAGDELALPSDLIESQIDGKPTSVYEWDVTFLKPDNNFDAFEKTFDQLWVLKVRSIMLPELSFTEGSGGTSSRNVAAEVGDRFDESQAVLMGEIDDVINKYMIPQLIEVNFPLKKDISCRKVTKGFGQDDVELSKALIQLIGQREPEKLHVDIGEILHNAGVPTLSAKQIEHEKRHAMEMIEAEQKIITEKAGNDNPGSPKKEAQQTSLVKPLDKK